MNKDEINKIFKEIGLSPSEIAVYSALLDGISSVADIVRITNEKRPTVYYSLNSLQKRGLVSKTGKDYGHKYQVESVDKLEALVTKKLARNEELLKKVHTLGSFYPKNKKNKKVIVSHFDSIESIKIAIFQSIFYRNCTIRSIVPDNNFFVEMGDDFIREYVSEKVKRNIKTKAIWEYIPDKKVLDEFYKTSEIKQLPIDMHHSFATTIFIYEDSTLYIGPKKESYAVLIESPEHAKFMKSVFENIWQGALEIN